MKSHDHGFSDYCVIGKETHWPQASLLGRILLQLQGDQYFTGLAGLAWRLMGVTRSEKNPNLCNG